MSSNLPTADDLMELGLVAYRDRDFKRALELFQNALDMQPDHWNAKLYAAMCHYKTGMVHMASSHFRFISAHCPDPEIRSKAEAALIPVNREAMEVTFTNLKRPVLPAKAQRDDDDNPDIEWVAPEEPRNKR